MKNITIILLLNCLMACKKDTEVITSPSSYIGAYQFGGTVNVKEGYINYSGSILNNTQTVTGSLLITTSISGNVKVYETSNNPEVNIAYNAVMSDATSLTLNGSDKVDNVIGTTTGKIYKISDNEIVINRSVTIKLPQDILYEKSIEIHAIKN